MAGNPGLPLCSLVKSKVDAAPIWIEKEEGKNEEKEEERRSEREKDAARERERYRER